MSGWPEVAVRGVDLVGRLLADEPVDERQRTFWAQVTPSQLSSKNVDRAIRDVPGTPAWHNAQAADVAAAVEHAARLEPADLWSLRPAVLQILACHPDGHIRLEATKQIGDRLPQSLVPRALDWVPDIRALAIEVLAEGWADVRSDTPWTQAAYMLAHRTAAVKRCPTLVVPAIASMESASLQLAQTAKKRRRVQTRSLTMIRILESMETDTAVPAQEHARSAMLDLHRQRLAAVS